MIKRSLFIMLALGVSMALVVAVGCKKEEEEAEVTEPAEAPTIVEAPSDFIAPVEKVVEVITAQTGVRQAADCMQAVVSLLPAAGDENLMVLLCAKSISIISAVGPSYPKDADKFDSASSDLVALINTIQEGAIDNPAEWKGKLTAHVKFLNGLLAAPAPPETAEKKLSDFYTKEELEAMKLKWKEYGDELKKKYAEMMEEK